MGRYINPFTDWGFKRLFGQEFSKDLLINFLNDLFEGEFQIKDVTFKDKEQLGDTNDLRGCIFDIYCVTDDDKHFIVEMQNMAILDGMSVRVADEVFILPLNAVMESLQPREADLHPLAGGERVLEVRGEYLPIVELWKVFNVAGAKTEATQGIVVILQSGGRRYALLVDQLIGQHQVVVKNLESNYRKGPGISAATILGDGSVALIVDVSALQAINREQRMANTAA